MTKKYAGWVKTQPLRKYDGEYARYLIMYDDGTSKKRYSIKKDVLGNLYLHAIFSTLFEKEDCICPNIEIMKDAEGSGCRYFRTSIKTPPRRGRPPTCRGIFNFYYDPQEDLMSRLHVSPQGEEQCKIHLEEMKQV